jgi:hypothetical protein
MRHRLKLAALVMAGLAVGVLPSGAASTPHAKVSPGAGYVSGEDVRNGGPVHGMIVADANMPFETNLGDLPRLAEDGVNTAVYYITQYFDNLYHPTISKGRWTPSDNEILTGIELAHAEGMTVQLDPILWSTGAYQWRGAMDPGDMSKFWPQYRDMILHYAELAQTADVETFAMGTEYRGMEKYTGRWRALARDIRKVYSGKLIYMGVTQSIFAAKFWSAVDYIGVSPYFGLSGKAVPSYKEMYAVWRTKYFPALARLSAYWHRPLLFNETGYLSAEGTAIYPADWKPDAPVSQTAQANAYAALLDAARDAPWLKGIVWFRWSPPTTPLDRTYSPRDKKAECVLAKRWSSPTSTRLSDGSPLGCLGSQVTSSVLPS